MCGLAQELSIATKESEMLSFLIIITLLCPPPNPLILATAMSMRWEPLALLHWLVFVQGAVLERNQDLSGLDLSVSLPSLL